jgi:hypothetical protein
VYGLVVKCWFMWRLYLNYSHRECGCFLLYVVVHALPVERGIVGKFLSLPCLWFSFEIHLCQKRTLSLFVTCGLFGNSTCHLIVWLSWLSCMRPCISSVNINVEFCGGIKLFMLLLAKPSTWSAHPPSLHHY